MDRSRAEPSPLRKAPVSCNDADPSVLERVPRCCVEAAKTQFGKHSSTRVVYQNGDGRYENANSITDAAAATCSDRGGGLPDANGTARPSRWSKRRFFAGFCRFRSPRLIDETIFEGCNACPNERFSSSFLRLYPPLILFGTWHAHPVPFPSLGLFCVLQVGRD